jgi:K+-transporting ATPase A subunit
MVGRTPEYYRQKIEALEIKMMIMALACVPAATLGFIAIACVGRPG